jgi:hypothetical protein
VLFSYRDSRIRLRAPNCAFIILSEKASIATGETMKNPLDSLQQTVVLGFVLTVVMVLLIHAIV